MDAVVKINAVERALVDQFGEIAPALPGGPEAADLRARAFEAFERQGLPHRRIEEWKYTDLRTLIREAYALLGLRTYFTAGPKESRAWTIPVGATAPQSAGVIHTDFEKGFIRAETIAYDDYVRLNGEAGAREAGKMRLEGKDYVVQDGDIFHFRFNV